MQNYKKLFKGKRLKRENIAYDEIFMMSLLFTLAASAQIYSLGDTLFSHQSLFVAENLAFNFGNRCGLLSRLKKVNDVAVSLLFSFPSV